VGLVDIVACKTLKWIKVPAAGALPRFRSQTVADPVQARLGRCLEETNVGTKLPQNHRKTAGF
jgi:hypothetical protein